MSGERPTLLIVDDEYSCREAFCMALEDEYDLIEAATGEEALNMLSTREVINLVLLDYFLPPGINGLEVIQRMKKSNCSVPVIIITGKGSEEVAVKAFRLGAKDYIRKPFKVEDLRATIRSVLGPSEVIKSLVGQAIEFMEHHYCQPISASDVAQGVCVSYPHLARLFKTEKGCTIGVWLNNLRMDKARVLLRDLGLEVKEVASKVGFKAPNYFCRIFKKHTGTSPLEYRKQSIKNDFSSK